MTSPEESSSTETRASASNLCNKPITVHLGDQTEIDLVVGKLYHDFSGHEQLAWSKCLQIGEAPVKFVGNGILTGRKICNKWGTTLLYLGSLSSRDLGLPYTLMPARIYYYFLADEQIIAAESDFLTHSLNNFIRLWPQDENLVHKNVYYHV